MNHVTDPRTDRPLGRDLHDWLERSVEELPDGAELPAAIRSDVLSRLPGTPQRRRWWPFRWIPFGSGATRSADREEPRPEGRPRSMFNAMRVAVSVIVLALVGSLAYVAAPTVERTISPAAPAAIDPSDFAGFSGEYRVGGGIPGEATLHDWGSATLGEYYPRATMDVDDPRLSGSSRSVHNQLQFHGGEPYGLRTVSIEIVNDDGAWTGQGIGLQKPSDSTMHYEVVLSGTGDYEGLSALLTLSQDTWGFWFDATGVIFPGELPPYPVLEDTEAPAEWTGAIDAADYAGISGKMMVSPGSWGEKTLTDWGLQVRGNHYERIDIDVDDPRLAGKQEALINYDTWRPGGPEWGVRTTASEIVNDDGSWVSTMSYGYQDPATTGLHYVNVYRGTGDYEGLSALSVASQDSFGFWFDIDGIIFPGELPPYPELPPAE